MPRRPEISDTEATLHVFDHAVFSRALMEALAAPDQNSSVPELYFKEGFRVRCFTAEAAQISFDLTNEQSTIIQAIEAGHLQDRLSFKMHNNIENSHLPDPAFHAFRRERPRAINIYLIRDADENELLLIVEGLVINDEGVLHKYLNATDFCKSISHQISEHKATELARSGHIWGNVILLDNIDSKKMSGLDALDEKIVQSLLRNHFVVISSDGQPVPKR